MASNYHEERRVKQLEEEAKLEEAYLAQLDPSKKDKKVLSDGDVADPEKSPELNTESTDDVFREGTTSKDTEKPGNESDLRKLLADADYRYNRFKGSTDRTISGLRKEVANLNNIIVHLKKSSTPLEKGETKGPKFSQDTIDILGEDTVKQMTDALQAADEKVAKLEARLAKDDITKHQTDAEKAHEDNMSNFMGTLNELVPDLSSLDKDPKFNTWLRESGPDGVVRLERLRKDQKDFDAYRVAGFFNEYKKLATKGTKNVRREVTDSVDSHRGPAGANTSESNHSKDTARKGEIRQSEINAHNRQVNKGLFKNNAVEAEAWETRIFHAMQSDKIIMDEAPI